MATISRTVCDRCSKDKGSFTQISTTEHIFDLCDECNSDFINFMTSRGNKHVFNLPKKPEYKYEFVDNKIKLEH